MQNQKKSTKQLNHFSDKYSFFLHVVGLKFATVKSILKKIFFLKVSTGLQSFEVLDFG